MIDQGTIERILNAAQIYDVVSDFVALKKSGKDYKGLCPFHDDSTPSFSVSPSKNYCKCFSCGEGGSPVHFLMKKEQMTYPEALRYLAKKYHIEIQETEQTDEQKQAQNDRESMFILNSFAQKAFVHNLFYTDEGTSVGLSYFRERGFRDDTIKKFGLGYALEQRDAFTQEALKAGYKPEYLEKTGLMVTGQNNYQADRFRGRVIFPIHTISGKVVGFGGRILKKAENTGKYVNSPESDIYHKSSELYGIFFARQAISKQDRCFLVEGYTDVIAMHQAGIENVVASSGTALTIEQIRLIHRFTNNVIVLFDGDDAGIKAAKRGIDLFLEAGLNVKVVLLPDGDDPDSFSRKQNAASFNEFIRTHETDFVQFKAGLLLKEAGDDPRRRVEIIQEMVNTIGLIPEEIVRLVYVKDCSRLLDVDEKVLVRAIAKRRQEQYLEKKKTLYPGEGSTQQPAGEQLPEAPQQPMFSLPSSRQSIFEVHERSILRYVIRYAQEVIFNVQDEETGELTPVNVVEYIANDLEMDELSFSNSLYSNILCEALEQVHDPQFLSERYFINHRDPEISRLAVDLVSDRYTLSTVHFKLKKEESERETLSDRVPYVLLNYKDAVLKVQVDEISRSIVEAQKEKDDERLIALMKQLYDLQEARKLIAKNLGERIITKL